MNRLDPEVSIYHPFRYVFPGAELYPDSSDDEEDDDLEERNDNDSRADTRDEEQEGIDNVDDEATAATASALVRPESSSNFASDKPSDNIESEKEKQPM